LFGLGSVQGFNTVVVRTRVDGQIDKIAFQEGQLVNQGDILAEIDPRPYQAALDQAVAKKAQDEANLANAKLDLHRYVSSANSRPSSRPTPRVPRFQQLTAQIAGDVAAISNARTQLDYATIRAPLAGVHGFRLVDQGNIVNASTRPASSRIDPDSKPIAVIFTAPEEQLQEIKPRSPRSRRR